ncbi:MAG TPA: hypothetical protein VNO52_03955, partial [Methylomirabilota bacterium]|nr:hypothetical protein [Methylomirabilota bacterium]
MPHRQLFNAPRLWPLARTGAGRRRAPAFRPALETLEERAVPAITPAHLYELNGSLEDAYGGPALVAHGGTLADGRYTFGEHQGLSLTGALADTGTYSIALVAELDTFDKFYNKVIDFQDLSSDFGLYFAGRRLQLYPGAVGADAASPNTDFLLVITRDGATGETKTYLNGILQQTYVGFYSEIAVPGGNVLNFFRDDRVTAHWEADSG